MSFLRDLKIAVRSLWRVRSLWFTVAITLALGIGANVAIFSVVRAVLLHPLANRDKDRLLYVRQSAPGLSSSLTSLEAQCSVKFQVVTAQLDLQSLGNDHTQGLRVRLMTSGQSARLVLLLLLRAIRNGNGLAFTDF